MSYWDTDTPWNNTGYGSRYLLRLIGYPIAACAACSWSWFESTTQYDSVFGRPVDAISVPARYPILRPGETPTTSGRLRGFLVRCGHGCGEGGETTDASDMHSLTHSLTHPSLMCKISRVGRVLYCGVYVRTELFSEPSPSHARIYNNSYPAYHLTVRKGRGEPIAQIGASSTSDRCSPLSLYAGKMTESMM